MELDDDPRLQDEVAAALRRRRAAEIVAEIGGDQPRLNLVGGAAVRYPAPVPQIVAGVLPSRALFQVFGPTGTYKSFAMLDLALSICNGVPWMGHEVVAPGRVALVLGEGGADVGNRIQAWLDAHPGASDFLLSVSVEQGLDLMIPGHVDAIIRDLREAHEGRLPSVEWQMVLFDTQADHMASGNEDKASDFTVVKRAIQRISQETGAAVGLVHHTGWDTSRERGSSRQRQALDVVMQVDKNLIMNVKQKFGPLFETVAFEAVPMSGSLYVRRAASGGTLAQSAESFGRELQAAKRVVVALTADPSLSKRGLREALGVGHEKVSEMLRVLDGLGYVRVVKGGGRGTSDTFEVTEFGREWLE